MKENSLLPQEDDFPSRGADPYIATLYYVIYQITYTVPRLHWIENIIFTFLKIIDY